MNTLNSLSDERLREILDFEDTDISDCPELTGEELAAFKPKHPEFFRYEKEPDKKARTVGVFRRFAPAQ